MSKLNEKETIIKILEKVDIRGRGKDRYISNVIDIAEEIVYTKILQDTVIDSNVAYLAFIRIVEKHRANESDFGTYVFNWIEQNIDKLTGSVKRKMLNDIDRILKRDCSIRRCYLSNLERVKKALKG